MAIIPSQIAGGSYVAVTGIAIGLSQGWPAYRGARSNGWPHVDGRITASNVAGIGAAMVVIGALILAAGLGY
jgi:hypothetical protein